jgi:hypothetical protein
MSVSAEFFGKPSSFVEVPSAKRAAIMGQHAQACAITDN